MNGGGLGETCWNVSKRRLKEKKKPDPVVPLRERGREPAQGTGL